VPLAATKTSCSGSRWATCSRQAARAASSRTARLPGPFVLRPPAPLQRAPPGRLADLLPLVLRPPRAVFQHRGVRLRLQPRQQESVLLPTDFARAAGDRFALQGSGLLLPHDVALDRRHPHAKAPGGFSQGPTVCHHPDNAFTPVSRIGSHAWLFRIIRALPIFLQLALAPRGEHDVAAWARVGVLGYHRAAHIRRRTSGGAGQFQPFLCRGPSSSRPTRPAPWSSW
jgi:hypothetical protein